MSEPVKPVKLPLFPVYQYTADFVPPENGTYYLITSDGIFIHKNTKFGSSLVPVKGGIPWLEPARAYIKPNLPKVPALILAQAHAFFRKIYQLYKAESYVTLMYSYKFNQYRLWCPTQSVSHGHVNYDRTDQIPLKERQADEWNMVGTIHSHCNFDAFHSGTDEHDESTFDGLHITIGHVDQDHVSLASSLAVNSFRQKLQPEECISGLARQPKQPRPKWMKWKDDEEESDRGRFFEIQLSPEDKEQLQLLYQETESSWLPKVTHERLGRGAQRSGFRWSEFGEAGKEEEQKGNFNFGFGFGYGEHFD